MHTGLSCCFDEDVPRQLVASAMVFATVALGWTGCSRQDERLQQHHENIESLASSVRTIGKAWLTGSTSGTYTMTALEQTYLLLEQERSALASTPDALADPRGARLSQIAEHLSRLIAAMQHDVRGANAPSVRQHLTDISALEVRR